MIITPARFEDAVRKIIDTPDSWSQVAQLQEAMLETLESMGYEAGTKLIRDWTENYDS